MDFILNEADVESDDYKLVFSDDEEEDFEMDSSTEEDCAFIKDSLDEEEDESFYRNFSNRKDYLRFVNQTRNPIEVVNEPEEEYYGEDGMPELFNPENREEVNFDLFASDYEKAMRFKDSLVCFPNVGNHFFYAIIYGLMHYELTGENIMLENAEQTLGHDFFLLNEKKLRQVLCLIMLYLFLSIVFA